MNFKESMAMAYEFVSNLSLTYILAAGLVIFVIWAMVFDIDQTVMAHGQIISQEKTQIIQAVDGGVLTELKVQEGQAVKPGEILAVLQKDTANAGYEVALAEMESNIAMLASIEEEYLLTQGLLKTGDVGYLEVARLKRQFIEMRGKVKVSQNKLDQQKLFLDRTNLTSPVSGNVKLLKVNTIGGVLKPGDVIMEIAPDLTSMLIEVKVNPSDIGLLRVGLPVNVKFDAFDYAVYGTLDGVVSYIGPDSLSEPSPTALANNFYRAHIEVPPDRLLAFDKQRANLKLGMSATVDIKTGTRSVWRYMLKPIFKGFEGALHEK